MQAPGVEYAIILNDPQLRDGLIKEAERSHRSAKRSGLSPRTRVSLAAAVRSLAKRVQASVATGTGSTASLSPTRE